jgi:iron(III) transport system ATP-binding protein
VADRIVVMNHGRIEQVGTPMQVYREPATPFVADFVGRINVLPAHGRGGGRVRIGPAPRSTVRTTRPPGAMSSVYLRPEDVLARPIAPGDSNVFDRQIDKPSSSWARTAWCAWQSPALGEHSGSPSTCRSTSWPSTR